MPALRQSKPYVVKGAAQRIAHVEAQVSAHNRNLDALLRNITHNQGNPDACLMMLSDHALGSAILSWFVRADLAATRQWLYTASRLDQMLYKRTQDKQGPLAKASQLLHPLVSDHPDLIHWFANCDMVYDLKRVEDVRTWDHLAYRAPLALRGDWARLAQRSQAAVDYLQATKSKAKYLSDQKFFLALANHDLPGMEAALERLTQPKLVRSRINGESGFTEDLIFRPAVIYAKIAWHHGHKVKVNSALVPADWLPMEPLLRYEETYAFLTST